MNISGMHLYLSFEIMEKLKQSLLIVTVHFVTVLSALAVEKKFTRGESI